jgi:hypothetical protein
MSLTHDLTLTLSPGERILPTRSSRFEPLNRNADFSRQRVKNIKPLPDKSGVPEHRFMGMEQQRRVSLLSEAIVSNPAIRMFVRQETVLGRSAPVPGRSDYRQPSRRQFARRLSCHIAVPEDGHTPARFVVSAGFGQTNFQQPIHE